MSYLDCAHACESSRPFRLLTGTFLVAALACGGSDATPGGGDGEEIPELPERPFAEPDGPYAVGTREYLWINEARGEPLTKDPSDSRHVLVQVWYPAAPAPRSEPALYIQHPDEFGDFEGFAPALHVRSNSVWEAPPLESGEGWPVLVYNHGGGWTRFTSTFQTEWLASHGYVVFSVGHTGFNQTVLFPDGYRFEADTLAFPEATGDLRADAIASWEHLGEHHFPAWLGDARLALDRIERLDAAPDGIFSGLLDVDRIGMLGWSFGGAAAISMSRDDPRVKAAIDLDGQLFGDIVETGTPRPIMLFHSGGKPAAPPTETPEEREALDEVMAELIGIVEAGYEAVLDRSGADWYDATIEGATHGDFSDLTLFAPSQPGQIDPRRAHEIINALTLQFFDKYLRGEPAPLLDGDAAPYPEVHIRSRDRG